MSEFIRIFEFRSKILLVASLGKSGIAERAASRKYPNKFGISLNLHYLCSQDHIY